MANFFKRDDSLLTPSNCSLLLVDYQPQMLFAVKSIDNETLVNNAVGLAKAARIFKVPTILTANAQRNFNGKIFAPLQKVLPHVPVIERTTLNALEDLKVLDGIKKTKREKLVIAGLWTEVCVTLPAIKALESGYTVYVVADACGATSSLAQQTAMQRMLQAGAIPLTWLQFLLELQRDWAREETCSQVLELAMEHAGTYGVGFDYAVNKTSTLAEEANFVI